MTLARLVRSLSLLLCGVLALWGALPARAEPSDIAAAARSVVRVVLVAQSGGEVSLVGHGSGFAIAPDLIVTNAHVVAPAQELDDIRIGVVPPQGKGGWFARIVAYAPGKDLALLRLTERGALPPATLYTGTVDDGADVHAVGYPGNVDLAQGLDVGDIVSPTSPVKTRGNVSAGRSSKQFETILHNASIGAGNSGGPLLDACGRVIGANSFGALSDGSDSEFYFAVSTREILRFLREAGITAPATGVPCRSLAEQERLDSERQAGKRALSGEQAAAAQARRQARSASAEREALFAVLAARDNGMALALLAGLLALAAGGGAVLWTGRGRPAAARMAGALAISLIGAGVTAWLMRPGFGEIESRAAAIAREAAARAAANGAASAPGGKPLSGPLTCRLDLARSRVTVSPASDIAFAWSDGGCSDGKTQFGLGPDGWTRLALSTRDAAATLTTFDPVTGSLRRERTFLEDDAMARAAAALGRVAAASCGADDAQARALALAERDVVQALPAPPNERLFYTCGRAAGD